MPKFAPPSELLADIVIPDRSGATTCGDLARLVLADEEVMKLKNADLRALREYRAAIVHATQD